MLRGAGDSPASLPAEKTLKFCGCRDASSRGGLERIVVAIDRECVAAAQASRQTGEEARLKKSAAFLQESKASTPSPKMARQSFIRERVWVDCYPRADTTCEGKNSTERLRCKVRQGFNTTREGT